jgi:GMP synthase-like glutamine amidotransferase
LRDPNLFDNRNRWTINRPDCYPLPSPIIDREAGVTTTTADYTLRIRVFQHVPFEGPARIGEWLTARGHELTTTRLFEWDPAEELPTVDEYDWLVVMGGPMSAADGPTIPWITPERECIAEAVAAGKTVLGICLGAQLTAAALGAEVYRNYYREIGWFPVSVVPGAEAAGADTPAALFSEFPASIPALHWHGETFSLPYGAELLARSDACVNQAFAVGDRVIGLQFHLEATPESAAALVDGAASDLDAPGPYVASGDEILSADAPFADSNRYMDAILAALEHRTLEDYGRR